SIAALAGTFANTPVQAVEPRAAIGLISLDHQGFYAGVRKGVLDEVAAQGHPVKLLELNAQGDIAKEAAFIETLIKAEVRALILSPVSTAGSLRAVSAAQRAGIPIVCYNTCLDEEPTQRLAYVYVVGNPFKFGAKLGEAAAAHFVQAGIAAPKIAVLNCEFVEVCVQRRKGFEQALQQRLPRAQIVANVEGTVLDKAVLAATRLLDAHPRLDAFFGESGGATLGAVTAVRQKARVGQTVVFGSDMTTELAHELIDGAVLKADVDVSGRMLGRLATRQALAAAKGVKRRSVMMDAGIDLYTTAAQAQRWLDGHPDGLP
ncbi:MAG: substrate-binding domain-containing protein, partial [Solirubrobacteraceae bacterium]|nr:substrate-binding domain-containing protein [Solirubrobacteraceae bacterium]